MTGRVLESYKKGTRRHSGSALTVETGQCKSEGRSNLNTCLLSSHYFCFASGIGAFGADTLPIERKSSSTLDKMKIHIGSKTFTATLYDNPTVTKLKAMLPLTLEMSELNGNEKYFHFDTDLPTDAAKPGTIQAGDLMLWQSNSLVLFYNSFRSSYSYTKLGRIDDASGLATAVGSGSVKVRFELERSGR